MSYEDSRAHSMDSNAKKILSIILLPFIKPVSLGLIREFSIGWSLRTC